MEDIVWEDVRSMEDHCQDYRNNNQMKKNALYRKRKDTFATDLRHEQSMHSGFWTLLYVFLSE